MNNRSFHTSLETGKSLLALYHRKTDTFHYHPDLLQYFGEDLEGTHLWDFLIDKDIISFDDAAHIRHICMTMDDTHSFYSLYVRPTGKPLHTFIFICNEDTITIALKDLSPDIAHTERQQRDSLTGLLNRSTFCSKIEQYIDQDPDRTYAVCFFNVMRFYTINELFGFDEANRFLLHIAESLNGCSRNILFTCRERADRFCFLADVTEQSPEAIIRRLMADIRAYDLPLELRCNFGVYLVELREHSGQRMLDKAIVAQQSIRNDLSRNIRYFSHQLRWEMLNAQEVIASMGSELPEEQFLVYYQPQFDHRNGKLMSAEALVRWDHPERGLLKPSSFINIFEKTGIITQLDLYVFEQTCRFLHSIRQQGLSMVPIGMNFAAEDIYTPNFVDKLEHIRQKYDVPAACLVIEVTEQVMVGNDGDNVNAVFSRLRDCGYTVAMDEFGSGHSSLSGLQSLDVDAIKLDMLLLKTWLDSQKGSTILASLADMARRLEMPLIAVDVEDQEEADFLSSIGCHYVQGSLYSEAMPQEHFEKLLQDSRIGVIELPGVRP